MIELVIDPRRKDLGGFEVERVLPHPNRRTVGPFVFVDRMGPVEIPKGVPRSADVRPHPHIGLSTLTYLFEGEIMHRDSVASEQAIRPGEVNWMTAGRGITHSERLERARREGDRLHGIQAWVALPESFEDCEPSFVHRAASELPQASDDGVQWRLIAGQWRGATAPVPVYSPLFFVHCRLAARARLAVPSTPGECGALVVAGGIEAEGHRIEPGQLAVFASGTGAELVAARDAEIVLLGGEPCGPRFVEWNFVSSSKKRIEQAKADWRAGRMKLPDADHDEFIPLPDDPAPQANPMS